MEGEAVDGGEAGGEVDGGEGGAAVELEGAVADGVTHGGEAGGDSAGHQLLGGAASNRRAGVAAPYIRDTPRPLSPNGYPRSIPYTVSVCLLYRRELACYCKLTSSRQRDLMDSCGR